MRERERERERESVDDLKLHKIMRERGRLSADDPNYKAGECGEVCEWGTESWMDSIKTKLKLGL